MDAMTDVRIYLTGLPIKMPQGVPAMGREAMSCFPYIEFPVKEKGSPEVNLPMSFFAPASSYPSFAAMAARGIILPSVFFDHRISARLDE